RTVRIRITDALNDSQAAAAQQRLQTGEGVVQADVVIDAEDFVPAQPQRRAGLVVEVVGVGDDGVQAVVAAGEFDDDQDCLFAVLGGVGGPGQETGHGGPDGEERRGLEKVAAVQHASALRWDSRVLMPGYTREWW